MNNRKHGNQTTILLADVRPLEDASLFAQYLSGVNAERQRDIQQKRFPEDRRLSLGGGVLLNLLLAQWEIESEVLHDPQGKPFVEHHPEIFVSLTHAYPYAAAMICDAPCGLDIESRQRDLKAISRRCFNVRERQYAGEDPGRITDIWCRKECVIKFRGLQDVRRIDTFAIPADYEYLSLPLPGYSFEILKKQGDYRFFTVRLHGQPRQESENTRVL